MQLTMFVRSPNFLRRCKLEDGFIGVKMTSQLMHQGCHKTHTMDPKDY